MTSMYRPPNGKFLDTLMHEGQSGVRQNWPRPTWWCASVTQSTQTRRDCGRIAGSGSGNGEGEWSAFFGQPAYTMTLIGKLIKSSGASTVMCSCKRLPRGEGFELNIQPLIIDESSTISQQINASMEKVIAACPEQYLWSYNRYKVPRGVMPPKQLSKCNDGSYRYFHFLADPFFAVSIHCGNRECLVFCYTRLPKSAAQLHDKFKTVLPRMSDEVRRDLFERILRCFVAG